VSSVKPKKKEFREPEKCCICLKEIRFRESWIYLFTKKAHMRCGRSVGAPVSEEGKPPAGER
jgi:hypothetical protein